MRAARPRPAPAHPNPGDDRLKAQTATVAPAMLRLDDNLAYRLSFVSFQLNKAIAAIFSTAGFSTHEWRVMSVLNTHQPMPAQAILHYVSLDKAAISRAVRLLLKR